jgi:hypothetical protein
MPKTCDRAGIRCLAAGEATGGRAGCGATDGMAAGEATGGRAGCGATDGMAAGEATGGRAGCGATDGMAAAPPSPKSFYLMASPPDTRKIS